MTRLTTWPLSRRRRPLQATPSDLLVQASASTARKGEFITVSCIESRFYQSGSRDFFADKDDEIAMWLCSRKGRCGSTTSSVLWVASRQRPRARRSRLTRETGVRAGGGFARQPRLHAQRVPGHAEHSFQHGGSLRVTRRVVEGFRRFFGLNDGSRAIACPNHRPTIEQSVQNRDLGTVRFHEIDAQSG